MSFLPQALFVVTFLLRHAQKSKFGQESALHLVLEFFFLPFLFLLFLSFGSSNRSQWVNKIFGDQIIKIC